MIGLRDELQSSLKLRLDKTTRQLEVDGKRVKACFSMKIFESVSKYPDEKGSGVIFVSKGAGPDTKPELELKDHQMLLNLFADNKPNLAITPHWTASLHAARNLDTAELEKVDFGRGQSRSARIIETH